MVTIYALQNIYGKYDVLMEALTFIDLENGLNRAVFLGNYMTKGPKSAAVLYELKRLEETYPEQTAVLPGETEQFFLTWLSGKLDHWDWLSLDNLLLATRSFFQERTFDELTNRTIREKLTGSDLYNNIAISFWKITLICFYGCSEKRTRSKNRHGKNRFRKRSLFC